MNNYFKDLLKTKIYIPPLRAGLVPRLRLIEKLNSGIKKKLILIQAPAGYGKTTLIVEWLSHIGKRHVMYSIDKNDNELLRFLTYIIFSIKQVDPSVCDRALPFIHSPEIHPAHIILTHLINDLECIQQPTTIVIDDYHLISSKEIHKALSFLLHNLPPKLQIVIVSRKELPFPISLLRAGNQVLELNIFDLRFTKQEIKAFVEGTLKVDLSHEELDEIDRKTEGWITSLQLSLMGTRWRDSIEHFQKLSGNDRLIAEYLLDEVIMQQPAETQDFLLKTSVCDRFCAPFCNSLLGINNSLNIIRNLERSNLFIIPLDDIGLWYRYHHLFAELLQSRLGAHQPDAISVLWKKASDWHAASGNVEEAIEYSLKAEDYEGSVKMIEPVIAQVLSTGGRERVIRWLSNFPLNNLRQSQRLWPYFVLAYLDKGIFGEAYKVLDNLWGRDDFIEAVPEHERPFVIRLRAGFLAAIVIHTTLDARVAKGLAQQSIDHFPSDARFGRSIGFGHYGSACLHLGEISQARLSLDKAIEESKKEGYDRLFFLWTCYQADVQIEAGNLHQARDMIHGALRLADERSVRESNVTSNATIGLGRILYEWNQLGEAEKFLSEGVVTAELGEYLDRLLLGYQHYFSYLIANREFNQAKQKIAYARHIASIYDHPVVVSGRINALEAMIDMEMGNTNAAYILQQQFHHLSDEGISGLDEFKWHTLAKAWIAAGNYKESINLLKKLRDNASKQERKYGSIQLGLTLAKAYVFDGNPFKAKKTVTSVIEMAEPEGYIRSFIDGGEPILNLMRAILPDFENSVVPGRPTLLEYVKKIISEFSAESRRLSKLGLGPPVEEKSSLLTARELDVISLLEEGLSYSEIAQRLVITENTLKTHIKHIYYKLKARNRSEAVRNLKKFDH